MNILNLYGGKIPRYPVPVMRIGKLASSITARGQSLGAALLKDDGRTLVIPIKTIIEATTE